MTKPTLEQIDRVFVTAAETLSWIAWGKCWTEEQIRARVVAAAGDYRHPFMSKADRAWLLRVARENQAQELRQLDTVDPGPDCLATSEPSIWDSLAWVWSPHDTYKLGEDAGWNAAPGERCPSNAWPDFVRGYEQGAADRECEVDLALVPSTGRAMPPDQKREIDFLSELTVAADKLGEKIRDGLITPSGCREGDTGRSRAPISSHTLDYAAITWTGRIEAKPGITIDDFMKAREITIGYFDIGFRRDEIIEHLSAGACDADHESPDSPAQITRTGKPGRPSIWDAIEPECRARFAAGERHPGTAGKENRSAWARELIKWFKSRGGIVLKEGAMQKTLTNHLSLLLDALESDPRTAQNK